MMLPTTFNLEELVLDQFGFLQEQYGFWGVGNREQQECLRIESDRYFIDFSIRGPENLVTIEIGRPGQPPLDLAWIFAYLTRGFAKTPLRGMQYNQGLYYSPLNSLGINGAACAAWQLARLKEIFQPMWPAVFIFFDMETQRSQDFLAFLRQGERAAMDQLKDGYLYSPETQRSRIPLGFPQIVEKSFAFLSAYEFECIHHDPILVRYEKPAKADQPPIYINVFHRVRSFQIGAHTGWQQPDPARELNFDMEELAAWYGEPYAPQTAQSSAELRAGVNRFARLFRRYMAPLLGGDTRLFDGLLSRRVDSARRVSRAWADRNRQ